MALQEPFRNAKAYSPQNSNAGKIGVVKVNLGRKWNPEKKYSIRSADMNELPEIAFIMLFKRRR